MSAGVLGHWEIQDGKILHNMSCYYYSNNDLDELTLTLLFEYTTKPIASCFGGRL
jgi:hypothetical protein